MNVISAKADSISARERYFLPMPVIGVTLSLLSLRYATNVITTLN